MEISRISQAPNTPASKRQATPETVPTAAPLIVPALPNNGVRVPAQEPSKPAPVDAAELKHALDAINKFLKPITSNIEFSIDPDSGRTLVKIVDTETNTVIRQTPSKEVLAIAKELDKLQGLLIREKA
ncbi:flagellar protein FlaG [Sulfuriferula plumbiphila]|uniref:flagellar protein FlaG n=1 Tax=Sulfuriferula plumbiphila TaxID=171865 RepID=UPI0011BE99AE|nr:flagellar protein FlaG [Sulfuriferula plumbiphila]